LTDNRGTGVTDLVEEFDVLAVGRKSGIGTAKGDNLFVFCTGGVESKARLVDCRFKVSLFESDDHFGNTCCDVVAAADVGGCLGWVAVFVIGNVWFTVNVDSD